ncbi:TonB-dependent receptor [Pedobacter sp. GR22-6]|uniref:TonB-dependent receptor n=1 Tax=Pedobacter sp. GR22-6 TaxID=3127957 RepID=UPI00307FBF7B
MFYQTNKRLSLLIVLFILLGASHKALAQHKDQLDRLVTINFAPDSLIRSLRKLEIHSHTSFAFDPDQLRDKRTTGFRFTQTPLGTVLDRLLFGSGLSYQLIGNDIVISPRKSAVYSIHGHIKDSSNGEQLIGATLQISELEVGVNTNQYGFYSLSVPEGNYQLLAVYPGYETKRILIHLDKDLQQEIELSLQEHKLKEVVIRNTRVNPNPILLNEQNFGIKQLNNAAYYAGETDVLKRLQMENGIKAITEGSSGLFVRGGNADQNLILLDEAIVYNPSHLYGLVSVFNSDAVNNLQVYRDYMPANFGGRLSSVIVNRMTEGNNKEFHLSGGLNLMSARAAIEGPLVRDKGSFIVAYRRSLLDVFQSKFKLFNPNSVYYDLNAKANYKINKDNSVFYSVYLGKDHLLSENSYTNNWGNLTSTLRWNHIFNSRVFLNVSAIYSNYSNLLDLNADTLSQKSQWSTAVKDLTLKADYTYYRSPTNQIKFGISGIYHQFRPGEIFKQEEFEFNIARDRSFESALYFSQQIALSRSFELNYGLRLGSFYNTQERLNVFDEQGNRLETYEHKFYFRPEPRINISYLPTAEQRIFATYNLNFQYQQLIQNSTLAFSSLEPWIPASKNIKPQRANQLALGYRYSPSGYSFSTSAYYKRLANQLDLTGHAQIIGNPGIREQLRSGKSKAYGLEFELSKTTGQLSGSLAYTYSKVFRTIPALNFGNRFVANYDIPHELKMSLKYELSTAFSFQSFFTWSTGRPLTLPVGYYQHDGLNVPIYEGRNTSRFPDFSRLDLSAHYQFRNRVAGRRFVSHTISLGAYNLYNRKNPLYYHLNSSSFEPRQSTTEYGFGFYPWIAYSFKI